MQLISSVNDPFVLSVEGAYGTGKTTFMEFLQDEITQNHYTSVFINAWETDFFNNPLAPIVDAFLAHEKNPKKSKILKNSVGKAILDAVAYSSAIATLFNLEKANKSNQSYAGKVWNLYEEQRDSYEKLGSVIESLAKNITTPDGKSSKLIVLVDELDRCRPDYAVRFLEAIKHLFSVNNVIFVIAIDKGQMNAAVKHTYGHDADSEEYLARFFDMEIILPRPEAVRHFEALGEHYRNMQIRAPEFNKICASILGDIFKFSPRTQSRIFLRMTTMDISENGLAPNSDSVGIEVLILAVFLTGLFYADRKFYQKWTAKRDIDEMMDYLRGRGLDFNYSITNSSFTEQLIRILSYLHQGGKNMSETLVGKAYQARNVQIGSAPPALYEALPNIMRQIEQMEIRI